MGGLYLQNSYTHKAQIGLLHAQLIHNITQLIHNIIQKLEAVQFKTPGVEERFILL